MGGQRSRRRRPFFLWVTTVGLIGVLLAPLPADARCAGDCSGDGAVSVDEIVTLVNIALGILGVDRCTAGDLDGDGQVTVDEILSAVADALGGCTPVASIWTQIDPTTGLQDIWGTTTGELFAVGFSGTIRHFDGNSWSSMSSGTTFHLLAVWGFAPDDVWAVGFNNQMPLQRGIILHYDGVSWSEIAHGQTDTYFRDVWGLATDDLFVVGGIEGFGTPGAILHFDGDDWTQQLTVSDSQPHNQLRGVWGFAADDVYAVGSGQAPLAGSQGMQPLAFHYDGDAWMRQAAMSGVFNSVWGTSTDNVYASGGPTGVSRFDGQQWSPIATDVFGESSFSPIWGFDPQDIFFGLIHYDGVEFVNTRDPDSLLFSINGLWGPPDGSVIYGAAPNGVWQLER